LFRSWLCLIRIALSAPYTYVTTKQFLLEFGLDTLRDLPDFEALEDAGPLSKITSCLLCPKDSQDLSCRARAARFAPTGTTFKVRTSRNSNAQGGPVFGQFPVGDALWKAHCPRQMCGLAPL